jgi:uncharacterized protein (DUF2141 family)
MKKVILFLVILFLVSGFCYTQTSDNVNLTIEVTNIVINGGKVYLVIFADAHEFRKEEPSRAFSFSDSRTAASMEVSLPPGEYVISAFQDANGNLHPDNNFMGVPRELIAVTNYSGKGYPTRNFDKQKIMIGRETGKITIGLYTL